MITYKVEEREGQYHLLMTEEGLKPIELGVIYMNTAAYNIVNLLNEQIQSWLDITELSAPKRPESETQ